MLKWAFIFLLIAIVAGVFGDVEAASATIAQCLFGIFLVLFVSAVAIGLAIGSKLTS